MKAVANKKIKRKRLLSLLRHSLEYKVIYICSYTGSGKTAVVKQFENEYDYKFLWINCSNIDKILNFDNTEKYIVLDNFEFLSDSDMEKIVDCIEQSPNDKHFIVISNKRLKYNFNRLLYSGNLAKITLDDFLFDKEEISEFLKLNEINISNTELDKIYNDTYRFPVAINLITMYLKQSNYNSWVNTEIKNELLKFINCYVFKNIDEDLLIKMTKISLLEEINNETVSLILNIKNANELFDEIEEKGCFFKEKTNDLYCFEDMTLFYLQEQTKQLLSDEELIKIYNDCALYYEKEKKNAIISSQYYILAKKYKEAAEILSNENVNHLGIVNYNKIDKYILQIPKDIIEEYPSLCINLAHIFRMNEMPEKAEYWYNVFCKLICKLDKKTDEYLVYEQMQMYYKICEPNTDDIKLADFIKIISKRKKQLNYLKNITITGNQPSILNGGKDLSNWGRHYKTIYKLLNPIVLSIFGENQKGAAEISIAETLYYQDKIDLAIKYLTKGISLNNNIDNMFCAYSLLDKIEKVHGNKSESIFKFEEKIEEQKAYYLEQNYEARLIENSILNNNLNKCIQWNQNNYINILDDFNMLERYVYFIKVKVLITLGNYSEALIILERLKTFIDKYNRHMYNIEYYILKSICMYFMNNKEEAFNNIHCALKLAQKYNYIRMFADEGLIVYNILQENQLLKNECGINKKFLKAVQRATKEYGDMYPYKYKNNELNLTNKELEIIKLIKMGYSNKEICEELYVSMATVKTHINHIYSKLGTKNRVQTLNKIQNQPLG